ncbi:AraC family transcriptional regulator [Paenibacillus oenotherae]|uniref:AraC family transcriptional regulator n=1 Tax=Paenibacillus oenotherae TaxID=1435645 RepID=A0ABS7D7I6_9BACL|nr:AraC family transcriptional regulator [Paenibacillus oenotherae]MBW7475491.1 AraC family transcriptional regulator [Paenibacillus oenotherae]
MNINNYFAFWNQASVTIHDIRSIRIEAGGGRYSYRLPASSFIYFTRGSATVWLEGHMHRVGGNYLLHGGKGMQLLVETSEPVDYFIILYKARLPAADAASSQQPGDNPSQEQYAFIPLYPAELRETAERMSGTWKVSTQMEKLYAKSLFYHFVYHLHWQMQRQAIIPLKPSLLDQAIQYMNDHYHTPITVESVAGVLNCSTRYLSKLFSQKLEESPVRVLTRIRLDKAVQLLTETNISLHEIAESTSYSDARALSRVFKKQYGMTPLQYRMQYREANSVPKWSPNRAGEVVVPPKPLCYIDNGYHNQLEHHRRGELPMFTRSKPTIAAIMFVCFTVLLAGCGATSGTNGNSNKNETANSSTQAATAAEQPANNGVKSFQDKFGTRDIPVHPQRIYAIGAASPLLILGIQPVGAPNYEVAPDYYLSNYKNKINIVGDYPPNYEAIIDLKPDMILASDYIDAEVYEKLAKIAPTATFVWQGQDVYGQLNQIADIVGKADEAKKWISEHQERGLKAKDEISQLIGADETISILWIYKDSFQIVGNRNVGHVIYNLLGLKPHPLVKKTIDDNNGELVFTDNLSLEALPDYDADRLIVMVSDVDAGAEENFNNMKQSGVWKSLKAVKNNKVYEVPYDKWWSYTVLSVDGLLDDAVELFKR